MSYSKHSQQTKRYHHHSKPKLSDRWPEMALDLAFSSFAFVSAIYIYSMPENGFWLGQVTVKEVSHNTYTINL